MYGNDLINYADIEELPDDPKKAFLDLVLKARQRLSDRVEYLKIQKESGSEVVRSYYSFVNVMVGLSHQFKIEEIEKYEIPKLSNFTSSDFFQFSADLDRVYSNLILDISAYRKDSVLVSTDSKSKIRSYVSALRDCVNNSNFPADKRDDLIRKINDFEEALGKRRVSLLAVALLTVEILAIPGALWASYEIASKLITQINQIVGEEKARSEQDPLVPIAPSVVAISPPAQRMPDDEDGVAA